MIEVSAGSSSLGAAVQRQEPSIVIQPHRGLLDLDLKAIWEYRDLLYFLVWRDVKVRYKQTVIGVIWAIIQPLLTMIVFSMVFGRLARIPSDGLPYPLFVFSALLPWNLFASSLAGAATALSGARICCRRSISRGSSSRFPRSSPRSWISPSRLSS